MNCPKPYLNINSKKIQFLPTGLASRSGKFHPTLFTLLLSIGKKYLHIASGEDFLAQCIRRTTPDPKVNASAFPSHTIIQLEVCIALVL